jgi:hypothetical protein
MVYCYIGDKLMAKLLIYNIQLYYNGYDYIIQSINNKTLCILMTFYENPNIL